MGRHRRSAAGRAATSRAAETTASPDAHAGPASGPGGRETWTEGAAPPPPGPRASLPQRPRGPQTRPMAPVRPEAPVRPAWASYVADTPPYGVPVQRGAAYPDGSRGNGSRRGYAPGGGPVAPQGAGSPWPTVGGPGRQGAPGPATGATAPMRPPPAPYGAPGRPAADAPPTAPYAARPTAAAPYVAAPRTGGSHVPPAFTPRPPAPARVSGVGPVESRDVALFDEDPDDGAGDDGATSPQEPLSGERRAGARKHRRRSAAPVRTGLLGASAAVALGAIAVTSGMLPGGSHYTVGGGPDTVHPADSPYGFETQGGTEGPGETGTPGDGSGTPSSPSAKHSSPSRSAAPSKKPTAKKTAPAKTATPEKAPVSKPPAEKPPAEPGTPTVTQSQSAAAAAAAQVLGLVNQERGKAGCSPVTADSGLADLATAFSRDMAARGFFDHTDPDGDDPWDRAKAAGISNLGGENIARGQADAQAVMESWMNSPGHRANILNCDYKTLGVGVYLGEGGPWWTQDFGF